MNNYDLTRMMEIMSGQQSMSQAQYLGGGLGALQGYMPPPSIPMPVIQPEPDKALLLLEEENAIETV